ncbi:MAG: exodeoxyribonuclease VII large subunit [Turicibacter sp.]|uniref:Exodeoxyribonuclease 7 large subunit n=1 Tax=Turicibacter faecis TaxID=2963365 RepID=A0ABN6ZAA6_9FIRM|nr:MULTISPECIES: exodeoxyribonuclease VII large subunit [unclassified Turicibacter]MCI8701643.1 exodeoxyribonuclease VII large subunit [Turicibacter sp.]BEH90797.1 exodeoxyribonuclease 7 large subunit [Turicibacter sp. TC023]MCI9351410.1 exodeoxyribonuclease VII large subunit [Turicibacter sp.]MCU7204505.1 exodeoxyribonuclease VII large subunit [Turicibacter sp. TA25]MCU7208887.1 exodeoxyribonuclease VII large subunit [Turicibacter sp. 1E2]
MEQRQPLTVKALTKYIKLKFDYDKNLQHLLLKGELSNVKRHSRGHLYFTLKDDEAQINAVMFASAASHLEFVPTEGMQVIVKGHITVYEAGGTYSLYVKEMTEDGIGNLYVAYTQLKERLATEGLFDARFKQKIPDYPQAVGVITSPTGAAIRDIISTIKRRFPMVTIYVYPALVQGEQAEASIISCIKQANAMNLVDTLIVGRGGGSIEDLWAFNKEGVARAIFESKIPIISAVGHETDFTIADFVADHRAPTPTGAAELAVPNLPDVLKHLNQLNARLNHNFNLQFKQKKDYLTQLCNHYIMKNPAALFEQRLMYVDQLSEKLNYVLQDQLTRNQTKWWTLHHRLLQLDPKASVDQAKQSLLLQDQTLRQLMLQHLSQSKQDYTVLLTKLELLNPLSILKKGYTVLTNDKDEMVTTVQDISVGQDLLISLDDGRVRASVKEIETSES